MKKLNANWPNQCGKNVNILHVIVETGECVLNARLWNYRTSVIHTLCKIARYLKKKTVAR